MDENKNIIQNVLISAGGNNLQLCDIIYDEKIIDVKPKTEKYFDWNDLRETNKRDSLLKEFIQPNETQNFLLAIPGAIDSHVHFDTPGFEFREDFEHASKAAAAGGVTTVIDMPCTSIPPVTSAENLNTKLSSLRGRSIIDYCLYGGISGRNFNEDEVEKNITELSEVGVDAFKVYMISGMDTYADLTERQMETAARIISKTGKPMAVHAEDKELVHTREIKFKNANRNDWKAYCDSRDARAEAVAIDKLIAVVRKVNCKTHVVHLSSHLGLEQIKKAKSSRLHITTETCPHYLYFTQKDFENEAIRNFLKTAPPVKCDKDVESLWQGLVEGTISFVVTDHAGCNPDEEKSSENFWEVYGGIPGVQHRVPFLFSEGLIKNRLNLQKTTELLSSNIADYFNIPNKGYLKPGYDADFCLIDLWNSKKINVADMKSKGKYTPFEGATFNAVVTQTFLRGKKIFDLNEPVADNFNYGNYLTVK
ncbi:MAG: allantoinase AllB [Ignavibacteria bacterium]|nr:allantoinase AllB [Ignavibacteria bacterium]